MRRTQAENPLSLLSRFSRPPLYAPVCTRFQTYDVKLDAVCAAYCETILAWAPVVLWTEGALAEPEEMEELEAEF